ncbi:iron-containing redox enzyme family protein [Mesorhizobium sp. L-8-10]|uniref:iron-containing redox enzyme family protein n=1 Tax=Mesorhizobium sp. L-8-10 TaxID=2744523 RepID=UPI0019284CC5|nr:iron-containing redox enzyme family protein [Mesorhizobium sp. L-8-10]
MTDPAAPRASEVLRARMTMCTGPLDAVFSRLWANENPREIVPAFLIMLHQIMRASVPVMEAAIRRLNEIGPADPLVPPLIEYYKHHLKEERDHDVWALEDLEAAGFDPAAVLRQMPPPPVARLAGAQRYWVEHYHPITLLGCIMVLESFPPSTDVIDRIRDTSGLPEVAFRTFRLHGRVDPYHSAEVRDVIDRLPLTRPDVETIATSLMACMESLTECISELQPIRFDRIAVLGPERDFVSSKRH